MSMRISISHSHHHRQSANYKKVKSNCTSARYGGFIPEKAFFSATGSAGWFSQLVRLLNFFFHWWWYNYTQLHIFYIFNFLTLTWNYSLYQTSDSKKISDIFTTRLNIIIDFLRTYYVHRHGYISSFSCLIYYRPKTQHLLLLLSWEMCINCNYTFQFSFRFLL